MIHATWMLSALATFLQMQATPPAPVAAQAEDQHVSDVPRAEPLQLGLEAGFAEIRESAAKLQFESAHTIADSLLAPTSFLRWKLDFAARGGWRASAVDTVDPLFDWAGANGLDENARAEVWYAKGVVDSLGKVRSRAEDAFEKARAGARDKTLRHDAIYDLGVLALEEGEEVRATIPEISGLPPAARPPMPPASTPGAAPAEPPDPIQVARAAYMKARGHFVERLRSDWRDADTQANVELCSKRLRELDEIEKKREEQKKQEEEQKKDQEKKDQDKKDQQKKKDDKREDPKDQDKKSDPDKGDSKDDPKPKDPKDEDQKKDEKKPEDPKPEEKKEDQAKQDARPTEQKESEMSREEMTQLLDRLAELEQEAQKIQAQLKAARRGKVKKDW